MNYTNNIIIKYNSLVTYVNSLVIYTVAVSKHFPQTP